MKKILSVILTVLLLAAMLCSCASKGASYDTAESMTAPAAAEMKSEYDYYDSGMIAAEDAMPSEEPPMEEMGVDSSGILQALTKNTNINEKIIYSAHSSVETVEFDRSVEKVYELIDRFGGFIENSYVSGAHYSDTYYGNQTYRTASFTVRVPKESYAGLVGSLSEIGNVTGTSVAADNITQRFTDTEARLNTFTAEEQRLLDMIEKAETVEDLISIEARLSEVRYQIESITSTLRNWQNQVDYSTVSIELNEVRELSEVVTVPKTFGEEIADGLRSTFRSIGRFFRDLAAWFIINLPVLLIIAAVIVVLLLIIIKGRDRRRERRQARRERRRERRASKKAEKEAK